MIKQLSLICFVFLLTGQACAEKTSVDIPLSIDNIQTHRVDKSLIRIIQYNMELLPRLEIELLATPEIKLIQKLVVEKIKLKNQTIDFSDSSGSYIESLVLEDGVIKFSVEHSFSGASGGEIFLDCAISVKGNKIFQPDCSEKVGE